MRHAPCMRLVQSGYERCAADYQTRIKALNEQTQEEHYYDDRYYEYSYEYADTTEPEYIEAKAEEALENVANDLSKRKKRQISDYPEEEAEENVKLLCCSFQKYLHCSETVVNTTCGYETAQFTKSFLDRMSGPLIQVNYCTPGNFGAKIKSWLCISGTLPSLWIWFRRLSDDNRWWPLGRIQSRISTTTIFIGNKTLFNIKLQYNVIFKHHYSMQKCNHTIYTFIHSTRNIMITNKLFRKDVSNFHTFIWWKRSNILLRHSIWKRKSRAFKVIFYIYHLTLKHDCL